MKDLHALIERAEPNREEGTARIEDGAIVIRVPLDYLPFVLHGAYALGAIYGPVMKITDLNEWAKEVCGALNREDEQGTTLIHRAFDAAMDEAINQGAFGIDEAPDDYELPASSQTEGGEAG